MCPRMAVGVSPTRLCMVAVLVVASVSHVFAFAPSFHFRGGLHWTPKRSSSSMSNVRTAPNKTWRGRQSRGLCTIRAAERSTIALPTGVDMEYFHAKPSGSTAMPPLVFVHGSFHGGWCWAEHWMDHFAELGYASFAPSLRGTSGTPVQEGTKSVELSEHSADIEAFMSAVLAEGERPVLVGHSFGGLYVQKVAEATKRPLQAMVLLASVGPSGTSGTVNRYIFSKPLLAWAIVKALVFKQAATDEGVCREVFFGDDVSSADLGRYMDHFSEDCKVGLNLATALQQFPSKTCMTADGTADWLDSAPPILVVGAQEDKIVDEPAVAETAKFYCTAPQWVRTSHEVMLVNGWRESADLVANWLASTQ